MKSFPKNTHDDAPSFRSKSGRSKHLIIQCPSCRTKFALEAGVLHGIEIPRFHCSRCDNVFTLDPDADLAYVDPETGRERRPPSIHERMLGSLARLPGARSKEKQEEWNPAPVVASRRTSESAAVAEWNRREVEEVEDALIVETSEPEAPVVEEVPEAPVEETQEVRPKISRAVLPEVDTRAPHEAAYAVEEEHADTEEESEEEYVAPVRRRSRSADRAFRRIPTMLGRIPEAIASQFTKTRRDSPWKGFAYLVTPILSFLVILAGGAAYLRTNSETSRSISKRLLGDMPRVAPAGLTVQETEFKRVALESGEELYVVSGKVHNNTQDTFTEVEVQGFAFDGDGKLITSAHAPVGSPLVKARIESLTPKMIEELQSERSTKALLIKPSQSIEFTVALLDSAAGGGTSAKAKYYSARVYSVKP